MDICVVFGPIIGVAVGLLKRIPFVKKNPKVVASILSVIVAVVGSPLPGDWREYLKQIVVCVIGMLAGAVTTHEVALKPAIKALEGQQ